MTHQKKRIEFNDLKNSDHFFDTAGNEYIKIKEVHLGKGEILSNEDPRVNAVLYKPNRLINSWAGSLHYVPENEVNVFIMEKVDE
jgi:hypothetical protein